MSHHMAIPKIGLTTIINLVIHFCRLYQENSTAIVAYINASTLIDSTQKTTLIAWLNGVYAACDILKVLRYTYES